MNRWNVTLFLVSAALALDLPVDMSALAAGDITVQLSRVGAGPVFTGTKIKFVVDIFNHARPTLIMSPSTLSCRPRGHSCMPGDAQ